MPTLISGMDLAVLSSLFVTVSLLLSSTVVTINASIHIYDKDPFREVGNAYLLSGGSEGIVASLTNASPPDKTPSPSSIHDGLSYIRFENLTFWRSKDAADEHSDMEHSTGLIQVIIFEAADRNNIGGSAYGGQRAICCTPDLAKMEGCKQGEVIRRPSATDINWPIVINVQFSGKSLSTNIDYSEIFIKKTGMYNLFFVACDLKLKGMVMSGKTIWKNADGYLPGRMAPLKKFYVLMALAYVLLSIIWFFQYVRFWKDILQLQHCITTVIALGLFEMVLWYLEYVNFNNTGMRPIVVTTWVVTVGAVRKTVSRLLILSVSMGYGVVRPTLGGLTSKVLLLGLTYFLASELLDITEYVGTINDVSGRARLFLVLPVAFLDAFLILWIFTSLSRTLEQLQAKRSSVKLDIYRKFSNALAVAVISSVAWIGYEVYFKATDPFNERWQSAWIVTAFWDILAFALLCVICYLWAPSQSSQRYAYSEEVGEESDDEEAQSLTRSKLEGEISLVNQEKNVGGGDGASDQDDGSEEDKRE
ncbi:Transmembrane protein like [Quillaja saponaria]|uniref:Transmembrane protein like n=1 Tax=Quillaja saponaria TaxID=32244 RepID=A0AAD7KVP6_QUISA|nr:Transmembrane protein like [Quillaja saponaria]